MMTFKEARYLVLDSLVDTDNNDFERNTVFAHGFKWQQFPTQISTNAAEFLVSM